MRAVRLELVNFRNIEQETVEFEPGVNLLCGNNAQGKTNLLEALVLLSTGKSFRAGRERDLIRLGSREARLLLTVQSARGASQLSLRLTEGDTRKELRVNGQQVGRNAELALRFCTVLFEPQHLSLVKEGPEERRRFLDLAISQLRPRYQGALEDYNRVMAQKNTLLRGGYAALDTLPVWNERLAFLGGYLALMRASYVAKLAEHAARHHAALSGGETLSLRYASSLQGEDGEVPPDLAMLRQGLRLQLEQALQQEIERGVCLTGPHRDDVELLLDGVSARLFGSQGQQRSVALSLKLGECDLAQEAMGEPPVLLLDDVMSELDRFRQHYIRDRLQDRQTIITSCQRLRSVPAGAVFAVKAGTVKKQVKKPTN